MDTWGIGLLQVLWKVADAIINTRVKTAVNFHGVLHGFRVHHGMGKAIMDLNMAQYLSRIDQDPLLLLLLDLRKAYDMLDRECTLQILEGYGSVPRLRGILAEFWENQEALDLFQPKMSCSLSFSGM